MRILQGLVSAQAVVLVALLVIWWQRTDIAPPMYATPGDASVRSAAAATEHATVPAGANVVEASERRNVAETNGTGGRSIVLQGRLLGLEPPPHDKITNLGCRQENVWRSAVLGNDGCYAIVGLTPGAWTVRCEVHGCRLQEFEHTLTGAEIQRLDITLARAVVLPVFVKTTSGSRLQSDLAKLGFWHTMHVIATAEPLRGDLEPTEHSSVGDIGLGRHRQSWDMNERANEKAGDGVLELDQAPPVHATLLLRHMILAQQRIEQGQQELRFVVDLAQVQALFATVRIRVVDSSGQPLAKARIEFSSAQGGGARAVTADDGRAEVGNITPGLNHFSVMATDRAEHVTHLTLDKADKVDLGDVVLAARAAFRGRTIDGAGNGVASSVQWTPLDAWRPPHPMQSRRSTSADGDGNFTLHGGEGRRYVVRAQTRDGRIGHAFVTAHGAAAEPFTIRVVPATSVVLEVRGSALTTRAVVVRSTGDEVVDVRRIEPRWRSMSFALPPGDYTVEIYDGSGIRLRREPLVVGAAAQRLEIPR